MEDNLVKIVSVPFWKGVYCKRKEFAPKREQILFFKSTPIFEKGIHVLEGKQEITKVIPLVANGGKYIMCIKSP